MFASTLPKNTMTQIRQVALVCRYSPHCDLLLSETVSFKCTYHRMLHKTIQILIPFKETKEREREKKRRKINNADQTVAIKKSTYILFHIKCFLLFFIFWFYFLLLFFLPVVIHSRIFYWRRRKEEDRNITIQKSVFLFSSQHSIIIIIILLARESSFSNYFPLFLSIVRTEHPDKGTVSTSFFLIIKKQF